VGSSPSSGSVRYLMVKLPGLVPVPPGPVTVIGPLVVPEPTVALIFELDLMVKLLAFIPLNLTALAPVKLEPLIDTFVPVLPFVGVKLEMVGAGGGTGVTVKLPALVAVPPGVVTLIVPVVVPAATAAVICVFESTL
jgi:hypothetical protein